MKQFKLMQEVRLCVAALSVLQCLMTPLKSCRGSGLMRLIV